jgi:hypothetical protein
MARAPDCHSAEVAIQRALVGVAVPERDIERALAHVADCQACGPRFEVPAGVPLTEVEEELQVVSEGQVDPTELFELALTAALSSPDAIARKRAARRLGGFDRVGVRALEALAGAATEDSEEEVRAAALMALDELDEQVSIPQRLIEAWSAAPAEAAPFIAGVLSRLSRGAPPGVTRLAPSPRSREGRIRVSGEGGIEGSVTRERDELWLELDALPPRFEETSPVVAVPRALAPDAPPVEWAEKEAGLVRAPAPVAQGSLRVRLGRVGETPSAEALVGEIYLLSPERPRGR